MPPRPNRPTPWRPPFLNSAVECVELSAELLDLAWRLEAEAAGPREKARVTRLREWAAQLEQRSNGRTES